MRSGKPYVLRDRDGDEITVAEARRLIAAGCTVPEAVRASSRANRVDLVQ